MIFFAAGSAVRNETTSKSRIQPRWSPGKVLMTIQAIVKLFSLLGIKLRNIRVA